MPNRFNAALARQFFGTDDPTSLLRIVREANDVARAAQNGDLPDQEARYRIWLTAFILDCAPPAETLMTDPRFLSRAHMLTTVAETGAD
ncbi:MAG: hypothetical protein AAF205_02040 [Pseudomonadota bacterium]